MDIEWSAALKRSIKNVRRFEVLIELQLAVATL